MDGYWCQWLEQIRWSLPGLQSVSDGRLYLTHSLTGHDHTLVITSVGVHENAGLWPQSQRGRAFACGGCRGKVSAGSRLRC